MIAAILERHGLRTGAYTSPHLSSYAERIQISERELEPAAFGAAVQRAARAAELVNRSLSGPDHVTQFEVLTAAAYSELAARAVEVAVIEAGLGGRYDATNVIPSRVQVLTSVGLEHTRWLGPTVSHIAGEKLDVVQHGGKLVLGCGLHPDAREVAVKVARERGARIIDAPADPGVPIVALGSFQRRNFACAQAAAQALLGELDVGAVADAAANTRVPGRLQIIDERPLTLLDGAHNPDGVAALAESRGEPFAAGRTPIVAVVSILDDKDAAGMLQMLHAASDAVICTSSHNPRALPPGTLQSLASQLSFAQAEVVPDPRIALARARELAGPDGLVLATGSIYLVGDLLSEEPCARASNL
jgi:dihydrofolate synthase/folylpolyglutamate synthase